MKKASLKEQWKRIVASILVVAMLFTSTSLECFAVDNIQKSEKAESVGEDVSEESYVIDKNDVIESENTENSTTYDAGNGILVTEFYGQDVRFRNEEGELIDYDASLVEVEDEVSKLGNDLTAYVYENKEGDKKNYFPENLTEETPLLLEREEYQIRFAPVEITSQSEAQAVQLKELNMNAESEKLKVEEPELKISSIDTETVELQMETIEDIYEEEKTEPFKTSYTSSDENVEFQYTSFDNGIKEEVILNERPEKNSFSFLLEVPGLAMRKNMVGEGLTIYNKETEEIVAAVQEPYMNDATGEAYSEAVSYSLETLDEEAGKYCLTLTVDETYLDDENRKYPVTIDPTLTWSDNSKISDVYVLSNYPTYNYYDAGISAFYLGRGSQGVSRAYMALADLSSIYKRYVKKATLSLRECTNSQAGKTIQAYRVTGNWSQTTVSWNKQPAYNATAVGKFTTLGPGKTNTMDLTALFQGYADRAYSNYGIMLRNADESTNKHFTKFFGARHTTASYRPKLTVEYYDRPATPVSVKLTPEYVKPGQNTKVEWTGITAGDLSYIQYRTAEFDEKNNKEIKAETPYSAGTKIGTTANGSADITVGSSVASGTYKTYKVAVRGVGKSGAIGGENSKLLKVDNAPPKGTIKVLASGTAEEVEILRDTVEIVGEVDGTGSPIKTSSMKLYDSQGNFVQDIYTNSTLSKIQSVFTPDIPNGTYTLRLTMEDSVGFTAQTEKQIKIVNRLSAPFLKSTLSNKGNVEIEWEFPYAATEVFGMAYKLPGSEEWNTVENVSGTKGKLPVVLPDEEGTYQVSVCGIDETGTRGEASTATCVIDKTKPRAELTLAERGMVYGTVTDTNLSEWSVVLKSPESTQEETVLKGTKEIKDGCLGVFDTSHLTLGVTYKLYLKAYDGAGNMSETDIFFMLQEGESSAGRINPIFRIKRPSYAAEREKHIVFPANVNRMELARWSLTEEIPTGTTRWYCDGQLVSSERIWTQNLPKEEGVTHSILATIQVGEGVYYSQSIIKNKSMIQVKPYESIQLPKGCVSFRLQMGDQIAHTRALVDGGSPVDIFSSDTFYISKITNGQKATASTISFTLMNSSVDTSGWYLEVDCVDKETFELSKAENYHPYEVGVKDKLNYKTYLKWKGIEGTWPEQISYEIYRGQEEGFIPTDENRIASDLKANYWAEMNVNYSGTFYYKIRAVEKDTQGKIIRASSYSNELASTVIDADEYVKRLGLKEYWEYAEFDTPSGNGAIEKSKGNLVYTQVDTEIPNEQLPVALERTYNSQSSEKTAFGVGWTHSFDMELLNICKNNSLDFKNIVLKDGNGTLYFYNQKEDGSYTSSMGKYSNLKKESKTEEVELPEKEVGVKDKTKKVKVVSEFTMETKDNVEYRFNSSGQMIYMSEANGNFLLFEYEPNKGLLSKVTTSKNLTMEFRYYTEEDFQEGRALPDVLTVKEILLPDGSKVSYEYTDARLSKVIKTGTDKKSTQEWNLKYNDSKQLSGITDAIGNLYQVGYVGKKANRITYPNGETIVLEYDDGNNQTSAYKEVTENGKTEKIFLETNTFEPSSGNSIQMVDSEGNSVTYEYMDNLLSKTIYSMTYQEIEENRIVEKTTEKTETKKYSSNENVTEEVDEDGIKTIYTYNPNAPKYLENLPVRCQEWNAEGYLITDETYKYDDNGNVIRSYDAVDGRIVETEYCTEDNPVTGKIKGEIQSEREYYLEHSENESSTESTYTYDASGKKTEVKTEKSGQYTVTTTTVYDVMGREISSTDTMGLTTTTSYDPFGRVSKILVKQGTITDEVTREYDANGALVKETEEDGTINTYVFDNMNRVVKEGIQKDGLSKTWTTDYAYGSVDVHTGKGKETVDHVLVTTEKNPEGEVLEVTYTNTLGRIIRQKKNGLYADYTYDREGHVTASCQLGTNPDNSNPLITTYLYDKGGNASGQILNPGYDADSNMFTVTKDSLTQSMTYDSTGNVLTATDGIGNTTTYTYDANGRVKTVTQPNSTEKEGNTTKYDYDLFDKSTKEGNTQNIVTDALGRTSVTTYNIAMQPICVEDRGDGTVTPISQKYTYDSKGRTSVEKDSLGTSRTYDYDGKDRVTTVHYKGASGKEELRTSYTYDKADNVTTMLDYTVSGTTATLYRYTEFKYDRLKRMTAQTELNTNKELSAITAEEKEANTTKYSYDIDGNLLSVTYPKSDWNVVSLKYAYDSNKWLESVKAVLKDGKEVTLRTYHYDSYGAVSEIKDYRALSKTGEAVINPEYTVCSYTYDSFRRPSSMSYTESTQPDLVKEAYTYTYDKNSRLIQETLKNYYPEKEEEYQDEVRSYSYDSCGNLVKTDIQNLLDAGNSYTMEYTYDAVGNRLTQKKTIAGTKETTQYTYNSLNQLTESMAKKEDGTATESKTYQYDANGNQIRETDSISGKETLNTYDSAGRLSLCTKREKGQTILQQKNKYNGEGTRIQKTEEGKITNYFYSQGNVLYTKDENGKETSLNLQGISGNIIATARNAGETESYYYYHKDPTGSTTNLRDADGKNVVSYQYTDFGETNICGDTDFYNEICYNGAVYDKSTGLYYLNARYYNPADGRFISRDSYRGNAANPSTQHLYVYCANNPINYDDPSGHFSIRRIVGGIVGGAVGAYRGYKVAKKKGYKGWDRVKAIGGRAIVGAAIGVLASSKNTKKVVTKAWSYVKKKLPSKSTISKVTKATLKKAKSGTKKVYTKTKKVISSNKARKTAKRAATGAIRGSATSAVQSKMSGNEVTLRGTVKAGINGAISSATGVLTEGKKYSKKAVIGFGAVSGFRDTYKSSREDGKSRMQAFAYGVATGFQQGVLGTMDAYLGDVLPEKSDWMNITARGIQRGTSDVFGIGVGVVSDLLMQN